MTDTTSVAPSALGAFTFLRAAQGSGAGTTLLAWALRTDPTPLQASPSPTSLAPATLTVVVDCPRALGSASVRQLALAIPVDVAGAPPDPTNLAASPPPVDGVSITSSGSDEWLATAGAVPGQFYFAPRGGAPVDVAAQSLTITIAGVRVNSVVGTAVLRLDEWASTDGTPPPASAPASGSGTFAVPKFPAGFTLGIFQATPANIDPGADPTCSTTLSWNGSAGASYTIQYDDVTVTHPAGQPNQPLPPVGSYVASGLVDDSTTFTLVVQAAGGAVALQQQATVNVNRAKIEKFVAFPPVLGQNACCTVTWVTNGDTCFLGNDAVTAPSGSQRVAVADTIDLTLTATRGQDVNQQARHVEVSVPIIDSLVALVDGVPVSGPVDAGTVVTLTWATRYAETLSLAPLIGTVPPNSDPAHPITVTVQNSTPFTLTCTGKGPPVTRQAPVAVHPAQITTFTVSPTTVNPGAQAVTLAWSTVRATSASVDNGVGAVSPIAGGSASVSIDPQSDVAFTLTCAGPDGPITAVAPLRVNSVRIDGFSWTRQSADTWMDYCSLDWSTECATQVTITVDNDDVLDGFEWGVPKVVGASGSLSFTTTIMNSPPFTFTINAQGPGASPVSAQTVTPDRRGEYPP